MQSSPRVTWGSRFPQDRAISMSFAHRFFFFLKGKGHHKTGTLRSQQALHLKDSEWQEGWGPCRGCLEGCCQLLILLTSGSQNWNDWCKQPGGGSEDLGSCLGWGSWVWAQGPCAFGKKKIKTFSSCVPASVVWLVLWFECELRLTLEP